MLKLASEIAVLFDRFELRSKVAADQFAHLRMLEKCVVGFEVLVLDEEL